MVEILRNFLGLVSQLINKMFDFQVEFESGHSVPILVLIIAFTFIAIVIYLILNALGIVEKEG